MSYLEGLNSDSALAHTPVLFHIGLVIESPTGHTEKGITTFLV